MDALIATTGTNWIATGISLITFLIAIKFLWELLEWFISKIGITTKRQREIIELKNIIEKHDEQLNNICEMLKDNNYKTTIENTNTQNALIAILKDRLYQGCNHFLTVGEIPIHELENLSDLYNAYSALGGNGVGEAIWNKTKKLRVNNT